MNFKKIAGVFACALIIGAASFATAGVPDLQESTAATAYGGPFVPVLFSLPNGAGSPFTAAATWDGVTPGTGTAVVDATITITLLDGGLAPVVNFPAEDLWLESQDGGLAFCTGGTTSDGNTDGTGTTQWAFPIAAGGASQAVTLVMVNGAALTSNSGLALSHNTADLTGDRIVNLTDVPAFAGDFFGGTNPFRSDMNYDGVVNLSDVFRLAQGVGAECP
jgi:hypothetical protein